MSNVRPPDTKAQLTHAMIIRMGSKVIGAINEWNPGINRTITDLYEFGPVGGSGLTQWENPGEPFEIVPGNVSGMQIQVRRWDLYNSQLDFGAFDAPIDNFTMLSQQYSSFGIREDWFTPTGASFAGQNYAKRYLGCWWSDVGRTLDAKSDRTINVSGTIRYTRRERGNL